MIWDMEEEIMGRTEDSGMSVLIILCRDLRRRAPDRQSRSQPNMKARHDFTSLKTVTFGDESAVSPNRAASIISVVVIFVIWGAFTGSVLVPIHVPGPFVGDTSFTYTAQNAAGETDDATVRILVHVPGRKRPTRRKWSRATASLRMTAAPSGPGGAASSSVTRNDEGYKEEGFQVVAVDGRADRPRRERRRLEWRGDDDAKGGR